MLPTFLQIAYILGPAAGQEASGSARPLYDFNPASSTYIILMLPSIYISDETTKQPRHHSCPKQKLCTLFYLVNMQDGIEYAGWKIGQNLGLLRIQICITLVESCIKYWKNAASLIPMSRGSF